MKALPRVTGLFETHLTVRELDRSLAFYRDVVGLTLALELPERGAAFFWIGGPGDAMLGLWSTGSAPVGLSLHIALKASLADVLGACDALRSNGITPLSFRLPRGARDRRDPVTGPHLARSQPSAGAIMNLMAPDLGVDNRPADLSVSALSDAELSGFGLLELGGTSRARDTPGGRAGFDVPIEQR